MTSSIENLLHLELYMTSPARRASRVLIGFAIALLIVLALGIRGDWVQITECNRLGCGYASTELVLLGSLCALSFYSWWILTRSPKAPFSDKISEIFDNLTEDELWSKLEQERLESNDVERISDAWAKLEVGILEDETQ